MDWASLRIHMLTFEANTLREYIYWILKLFQFPMDAICFLKKSNYYYMVF